MKKILLNKDISIDLDRLIQSRMVILANSGSGKSWAIRRIAEESIHKIQTIIIDPEGEFSSLREKHDLILCGKDSDVPVETRSASLLATKLLEINKSAVLDLYELHPRERQTFVKLFCESLVNAPKHLYHPVLIILDEAHDYVPEGKPSEATYAVEALASKGRKRGQCLILASQRISKLSKNASAECNNKLIGRASQDIDYIRAGAELGFNKADSATRLRNLKPGQFYAYGPAISDDIIELTIGSVQTTHEKIGYKQAMKVPPASDAIKKVLEGLKDLPQVAQKEAQTVAELKKENAELKGKNTRLENSTKVNGQSYEEIKKYADEIEQKTFEKAYKYWYKDILKAIRPLEKYQENIFELLKKSYELPRPVFTLEDKYVFKQSGIEPPVRLFDFSHAKVVVPKEHAIIAREIIDEKKSFNRCAKAIYSYLHSSFNETRTKTQIAVATGYSQNSGGFNNALSELSCSGLITRSPIKVSIYNRDDLIIDIDTFLEKWLSKLGACSRKIWKLMLDGDREESWSKNIIAERTSYSVTSGGFNNSISELSALGLIVREQGSIKINPEILNL